MFYVCGCYYISVLPPLFVSPQSIKLALVRISVLRVSLTAPAKGHSAVQSRAASLLFRLGWHISSGKLDFRCFPHFSSFSANTPCVVKAAPSRCHQGRSSENNALVELLRFSNSLADACSWEWTQQDRQQGRLVEQLHAKKGRIGIEVRRGQGVQAGSKGVATNPYQWHNEIIWPCAEGSHR